MTESGHSEAEPAGEGSGDSRPRPDLTRITERLRGPLGFTAAASGLILVVVLIAAAKFAQLFLLPLVLAVVLNFLLSPAVRTLSRWGIPTPAAAAVVMLALVAGGGFAVYTLSGPTAQWMERAPRTLRRAEIQLRGLQASVEKVKETAREVEEIAEGGEEGEQDVTVQDATFTESLTSRAQAVAAGGAVLFFLLFFLLASGDLFLRKLARVLPRFGHRRDAVDIVRSIESEVSTYLFTMSAINVGLGVAVGAAMWVLDMPNPVLWGCMAGVLNFVPYVGPVVGVLVTFLVGVVTFDTTARSMIPSLAYLVLNTVEGYLVTPHVMGRRLRLNPVALLVGIMFWGWLWGIPGALLAVPLVAITKIVSDHIELLSPLGEFLGA